MKTELRNLKYTFSEDEIKEKGRVLADLNSKVKELEDAKKASASEYASKIDSTKATINNESLKINQGYEHRDVKCEVDYHKPVEGRKTLARTDTGEVWDEQMTSSDYTLFNGM